MMIDRRPGLEGLRARCSRVQGRRPPEPGRLRTRRLIPAVREPPRSSAAPRRFRLDRRPDPRRRGAQPRPRGRGGRGRGHVAVAPRRGASPQGLLHHTVLQAVASRVDLAVTPRRDKVQRLAVVRVVRARQAPAEGAHRDDLRVRGREADRAVRVVARRSHDGDTLRGRVVEGVPDDANVRRSGNAEIGDAAPATIGSPAVAAGTGCLVALGSTRSGSGASLTDGGPALVQRCYLGISHQITTRGQRGEWTR